MEFGWALATIAAVGAIIATVGLIGGNLLLKQAECGPEDSAIQRTVAEPKTANSDAHCRAAAFDTAGQA